MSVLPDTRIMAVATTRNPATIVSDDIDLGQVHRVHLKTAIIPNTEYNVNSKSAAVDITAADMLAVGPIPLGQYNIASYLAALKVVLDVAANPNTFTVTQDALTRKLVFTKSAGAEFTVGARSASSRLIGQTLAKTSAGLVLTTDSIPDLSGLRLVVFRSYTLGKWRIASGETPAERRKTNVIGSAPMTATFGSNLLLEQTEETLDSVYFAGYKNISSFEIALVDENDELLELNGSEYILEFEAHVLGAT